MKGNIVLVRGHVNLLMEEILENNKKLCSAETAEKERVALIIRDCATLHDLWEKSQMQNGQLLELVSLLKCSLATEASRNE